MAQCACHQCLQQRKQHSRIHHPIHQRQPWLTRASPRLPTTPTFSHLARAHLSSCSHHPHHRLRVLSRLPRLQRRSLTSRQRCEGPLLTIFSGRPACSRQTRSEMPHCISGRREKRHSGPRRAHLRCYFRGGTGQACASRYSENVSDSAGGVQQARSRVSSVEKQQSAPRTHGLGFVGNGKRRTHVLFHCIQTDLASTGHPPTQPA
jgi:hypothetical protein